MMLAFDFDDQKVDDLAKDLDATPKQVKMSMGRAVKRTAGTIRRMSSTGLRTELGLKNATALRRRIKEYRVGKGNSSIKLWYGANDLPLSAFPGRAKAVQGGVKFGDTMIHGGFVAKVKNRRAVYVRTGKGRWDFREASLPVGDRIMIFLEDEVFVDIDAILWKHFAHEIRARTTLGVGNGKYS